MEFHTNPYNSPEINETAKALISHLPEFIDENSLLRKTWDTWIQGIQIP